MKQHQTLKMAASFGALFIFLVGMTLYMSANGIITANVALLTLVALLGLYIGFGILIAVYRLVNKL